MTIWQQILYALAISWWSTALVAKNGPFNIFEWPRKAYKRVFKSDGPFVCFFCLIPWIAVSLYTFQVYAPQVVAFFGILGLATTLRGMSNEYV